MLGCRTAIGVGCCVLALVLAPACGGSVAHGGGGDDDGGSSATAGRGGRPFGGSNSGRAGTTGIGGNGASAAGGTDDPPPVTTACPPEELPPPDITCDPFDPASCGAGLGCYPYVDHPEGSGCDAQVYGTQCVPVGSGTQGSLCGEDVGFCAAGFVCVVGQRAGKRCAQLCKLGEANQCESGLLCGDLDVSGFGVCG